MLRSVDVSDRDKTRIITCLKKNISYQELKGLYDSLDGEKKKDFYDSTFSVWEQTQKFMQNTTITWKNNVTLVYKVNADRTIEFVKSLKSSDYKGVDNNLKRSLPLQKSHHPPPPHHPFSRGL